MQKITVIDQPMNIHSGRVGLSAEQARRRRHALREIDADKGVYEIERPVQFKVGESFDYDRPADLPTGLRPQEAAEAPKQDAPKASTKSAGAKGAAKPQAKGK